MIAPIRVLIVDDSRIVRGVLRQVLSRFPDLLVVGEAGDGQRAAQLARELRPDVVTLDLLMPLMGGIETIDAIMRDSPTAIVVVADLDDDARHVTLSALAHGALEVFPKPRRGFDEATALALATTLRLCSRVKPPRRSRPTAARPPRAALRQLPDAVGIVASTGGPRVLLSILRALSRQAFCPILIVQHTMAGSTEPLAEWLRGSCDLRIEVARAGQRLGPGQVVLAPYDMHLSLTRELGVALDSGPRIGGHRPAGTRLLQSLAAHLRTRCLGVILSGMGSDGADGAAAIEAAGGAVLIEDPATAAVSGMPTAALSRTRAAIRETSDELGSTLAGLLGGHAP
jgi:two-component system chemotaxis response regulator CheB